MGNPLKKQLTQLFFKAKGKRLQTRILIKLGGFVNPSGSMVKFKLLSNSQIKLSLKPI
jgi:hypothetical protein